MSLVDKVKHDLLSVSAVIVTTLHLFMIIGGLAVALVVVKPKMMGDIVMQIVSSN